MRRDDSPATGVVGFLLVIVALVLAIAYHVHRVSDCHAHGGHVDWSRESYYCITSDGRVLGVWG